MDKRYVIDRVRSDLRNEIYELMTHPGYHSLEKELTESLLNANLSYQGLRRYSLCRDIPLEEKERTKQLFAYMIYREMNARLGGFHFNRYRSFSTGEQQDRILGEVLEAINFDEFVQCLDSYLFYEQEPEFKDFAESKQFRNLEDCITSGIKKNTVIPALSRAIAQDVVDALHLDENYTYLRVSPEGREELFSYPSERFADAVSLRKIRLYVGGEHCHVLLKRTNRTSNDFRYLLTDFGAIIKGI